MKNPKPNQISAHADVEVSAAPVPVRASQLSRLDTLMVSCLYHAIPIVYNVVRRSYVVSVTVGLILLCVNLFKVTRQSYKVN